MFQCMWNIGLSIYYEDSAGFSYPAVTYAYKVYFLIQKESKYLIRNPFGIPIKYIVFVGVMLDAELFVIVAVDNQIYIVFLFYYN